MAAQAEQREMFIESDSDDDGILEGGNEVYYKRDTPGSYTRLPYCKSMVDRAIDYYNKENSKKYHMVELISFSGMPSYRGDYLSMDFTAKLDDDDTNDVVTFEAHLFDGLDGTVFRYVGIGPPNAEQLEVALATHRRTSVHME